MSPIKARNTDLKFKHTVVTPDLAAGADITDYHVMDAPFDMEVTDITVTPVVASAGVDGSNSLVFTFKRNNTGTAIGTLTKTAQTVQGTEESVGTLDGTTKFVDKDDEVTLDITQGATADVGLCVVEVTYRARQGK